MGFTAPVIVAGYWSLCRPDRFSGLKSDLTADKSCGTPGLNKHATINTIKLWFYNPDGHCDDKTQLSVSLRQTITSVHTLHFSNEDDKKNKKNKSKQHRTNAYYFGGNKLPTHLALMPSDGCNN